MKRDTDTILRLLREVEWRRRANRLRRELTTGLSSVLALLVAIKIRDLYSPLTGATIAVVAATCAGSLAAYGIWRFLKRDTLADAAESIDRKAGLHDEITTALWFIDHPRASEWVERQIQRAAAKTGTIDLARTYPATVPRTFYLTGALTLLFVALNIVPLPQNHNWLMLRALSTEALAEADAPASRADSGRGSPPTGSLESRQSALEAQRRESIRKGLEEIAADLRQAEQTESVADAIMDAVGADLKVGLSHAAEELRRLAADIAGGTPAANQDLVQGFREASAISGPWLEALAHDLGELASAIESHDRTAIQEALEDVVAELESLEGEMLVRLPDADDQPGTPIEAPPGEDPAQTQQAGRGQGPMASSNSLGLGGSRGTGRAEGPREGAPTTLDVKLKQEGVKGMQYGLARSPTDVEEASRRERSTLDYRNVPSECRGDACVAPTKDVLDGHKIPWEYRPLIKSYFEAIHNK